MILSCNSFFAQAQKEMNQVLKEIANSDSVVWFGLDFSNAKFIGDFSDRKSIMDSSFDNWNSMLVSTDLLKSYRTNPFFYDFTDITKRNKGIKENDLFTLLPMSLTTDKVQSILHEYNPVITKGKGLVFMVESFDNNRREAKIWFVYFDIKTKRVIHAQPFNGLATGTNQTKCWEKAIHRVISASTFRPVRFIMNGVFYILVVASLGIFISNSGF